MKVIDVDSHFEPGESWLASYPDLIGRVPRRQSLADLVVEMTYGDLFRRVPEDQRPASEDIVPHALIEALTAERDGEAARRGEFQGQAALATADGEARIKWMDAQGVDYQNVICLSGIELAKTVTDPGLAREAVGACNDWLANTTAPFKDRLFPVTVLECSDLNWAADELARMRARGSRQFILPAYPIGGIPPCHPDWDPIWAAACELGMLGMIHGGYTREEFDPGWANTGGNPVLQRRIGHTQHHQNSQILAYALIFGGVFERHPDLTLVFAEVFANWVTYVNREIDNRVSKLGQIHTGKWEYPLLPSEYLRRNIRVTPLPSSPQEDPTYLASDVSPEIVVFSSDFPHIEGSVEPVAHYEGVLKDASPEFKLSFYGDNINNAYARMGDPLY